MKNVFLRLVFTLVLFQLTQYVSASHIVGGEMSYVCMGSNHYQITLKVFRDCFNGQAAYDDPTNITIYDANGVQVAGSPFPIFFPGSDTLDNNSGNTCMIIPPGICVEEADFVTTVTLPPSPGGYTMVFQRCCRNLITVNIIDPANTGTSYVTNIPDSSFALCNSSPSYNNFPPTFICVDEPFTFDHSATDPDGDLLLYQLCAPFMGGTSFNPYPVPAEPPPYGFVTYQAPYAAIDPMGGNPPMAIDATTGLLTVTPNTLGNFVVGVCVEEYRNGNFLGEHKRDFQFNVVQCGNILTATTPDPVNNCSGYTINFVNNSIGGTIYHWDFGVPGITDDTSNLFSPTFTFPDTGVYTVTLSVNPNDTCTAVATSTVYVFPSLNVGFNAPNGIINQPIQFTDQSTTTFGSINSWLWNFGDGTYSNIQNPLHSYQTPADYTAMLVAGTTLGCENVASQAIHIEEFNGIVNPDLYQDDYQVEIYNIYGERQPEFGIRQEGSEWKLNDEMLPAGIYFIRFRASSGSFTRKIIVPQ